MRVEIHEIRPAIHEDVERLNAIYNHYVRTSAATFDVDPIDAEARRRWLDEQRDPRHRVIVADVAPHGVAGITQPNAASVGLHERFGFRRVGRLSQQGRKFGRYWDVDWFERPVNASSY